MIADIFFINPCVEGLRIFDVLPAKAALAPRALAQAQMNALHAAENPLYLPFRMQLLMKQLVYGMAWSYAFPCFYALVLIFLAVSVVVDESGLLRTFRGLITSSDKLYDAAVTQMLPAALVLHCTLSFFTAHHMEMQNRDLILANNATDTVEWVRSSVVNGVDALGTTLEAPAVVLSAALLVGSLLFATVFIAVMKLERRERKRRARERLDLASADDEALARLSRSSREDPKPADGTVAAASTTAASGKEAFGLAGVSFRELDKQGANPQMYLPPLSTLLLMGARRRNASKLYDGERLGEAQDSCSI